MSHLSAYLHTCVSVLEGQIGHPDEARRHCDIADSLLEHSPNTWLTAASLLNRGCVACLNCEFAVATSLLRSARTVAQKSGHATLTRAADASGGHVLLLTGEFATAERSLTAVLDDEQSDVTSQLGAVDGLARIHLALNQLDDVERVLHELHTRVNRYERPAAIYHARWATITEARLLIKRGSPEAAIERLKIAEEQATETGDTPLAAVSRLVKAHAFSRAAIGDETARCLTQASELGITGIRELQAQYYYASAQILGARSPVLSEHLRDRALRLWAAQGIVSVQMEMDDADSPAPTESAREEPGPDSRSLGVECVTDSLAALGDLAHRPRLLGDEMVSVIKALGCSPKVVIAETTEASPPPTASPTHAVLALGTEQDKELALVCAVPSDPEKAILLANVLRLGRASLELERARQAERSRAAVWPASPAEEQAGALFLADEMQTLLAVARRIAATSVPVLLTGETGTGKEVLARTIHAYSDRSKTTFLPFNCSGVPPDMLDSQLFGHRKGSFTGATDHFPGVIRAATGGTLFLDEIGDTTLEVQPKLLRFLESHEVHPIGELQPIEADVRVIAATNADLDTLVANGRFREDLFYRLSVVRLHLPPLRERRMEIPAFADHFLRKNIARATCGWLRRRWSTWCCTDGRGMSANSRTRCAGWRCWPNPAPSSCRSTCRRTSQPHGGPSRLPNASLIPLKPSSASINQ